MASLSQDHRPDDDDVDDNVIAKLQLQDPELSGSLAAGKGRSGEFTDESHALQLQQQELEELENDDLSSSNRSVAQSSDSVQSHVPTAMNTTSQEANIAGGDHDLAQTLKGNAGRPDVKHPKTSLGHRMLSKLKNLFKSKKHDQYYYAYDSERRLSFTLVEGRPVTLTSNTDLCEACGGEKNIEDLGCGPCGHEYCRDCLQDLVKAAITDQSLFPPRCCRQPIPLETIRSLLTSELVHAFIDKKIESDTPNKTYCSVQTCSAFIRSANIANNVGTCLKCDSKTCTLCKEAAHGRGECPSDPEFQQILEMVRENGWQRCYMCSSVVELNYGCNHITCRCGTEFCYLCGLRWKSCTCAQWDEHRLIEHANVIVARQPETRGLRLRERFEAFKRTIQNLRENHECQHLDWRYVRGPGYCEICGQLMTTRFIQECKECYIWACKRCRKHRL
ncbi:hypothetical protein VC83_01825 [Pseudogymnoascus destructans]|uniref:RBR-type E3 ubiquitin transferase n=2 Tax=Pseudogymnoascus destructans TaxID=655981 RepID=L8FZP6_PSED2|nr:uncharacterized protein VC83_01825 [Pseudogymnoascus destructans]ELR05191.1 hypothetical protein GMDG_07232 [Pseudogymnoascus destructans 20631-21]OAF61644.1 hypothetical protein VC83_01825 [Pseudogymnoascus destructans]